MDTGGPLLEFFNAANGLGKKLGPVLVQLPPKLAYDAGLAQEFLTTLRELHPGSIVLEPRHVSWFTPTVDQLLRSFEVTRVAADPPKGSELARQPGGWPGLRYWRLHGSPRAYYSDYEEDWLQQFAEQIRSPGGGSMNPETWVIFDNTALGHAVRNAIRLAELLQEGRPLCAPGPHP